MRQRPSPKLTGYYYLILGLVGLGLNMVVAYASIRGLWLTMPRELMPRELGQDCQVELMTILICAGLNLVCLMNIYQLIRRRRRGHDQLKMENAQLKAELQTVQQQLAETVQARSQELADLNQRFQREVAHGQTLSAQLRISEQRLAGILDIAGNAVITFDKAQTIMFFNQAAENIFGYSAAEAIGQSLDLLMPDRFVQIHRQHVSGFGEGEVASRQMGDRQEVFGRRKDGSEFPAEASISRLRINDELIYTVILRDVSERKYLEQMKDEFIAIVSHELRTPLTSVHGALKILVSGLVGISSAQGQQLLTIAANSTDRLVRLINDILDIEKIDANPRVANFAKCSVIDLLQEVMQSLQAEADAAAVQLKLEVTPDLDTLVIWADHDRIIQVLMNLINNAIQFSPPQGTVWLTATPSSSDASSSDASSSDASGSDASGSDASGGQVQFRVKDQGYGIPAEKLGRVFERFQQVDSSSARHHEGSGLGLAICRSIVQQHQGKIWLESTVGEGSTFYFTIPIVNVAAIVK
jgi:PAS domain S-box-containing protein